MLLEMHDTFGALAGIELGERIERLDLWHSAQNDAAPVPPITGKRGAKRKEFAPGVA